MVPASMKKFLRVIVLWSGLLAVVRAQTPSPLASAAAIAATAPAAWIVAEDRANNALAAGFPTTALAGYRELSARTDLPAEVRARVSLARVTALMETGEIREADAELQRYEGPHGSAYELRSGLLAANARRWPQAKAALVACRIEDLPPADRGWWYFLQAEVADSDNDIDRRNRAYADANRVAVSELQRVGFLIGQQQALLRVRAPAEADLAVMRGNMERMQGTRAGYTLARNYAAALHELKRNTEALAVLQHQLVALPATERETADQFRLLLGLIAGAGSPEGRRALRELMRDGLQPDTQRTALYLLARAAQTPVQREQLRRDVGELIDAPVLHPVIEDLLLVRAQASLADRQYNAAEDDARLLLERYPGSPLKPAALGVRLSVAWELQRYRSAADLSAQLRAVLPPGREHAELGVLQAEAFFRSGDYQSAGEAYDAVLHEAPQIVPAGVLLFQRVLSEIRAGQLEAAAALLDEMAGNSAFDPVNRWQAEWNLVKEMQVRGQIGAAQARVEKLLSQGQKGVPDELRIRLLWLRAKLSYDNNQPEAAAKQVDALLANLSAGHIELALRDEVASTALLVKAQALLLLGRDDEGAALLEKLRTDYRATKAAVYSYIVQAGRLTVKGETVKAQQLLIKLADEHKDSEFAPLALYEAALNAERRGLDDYLREAYNLLERLVHDYPGDDLVFYARLKQGDLLRKLNDFKTARQFYDNLINNYSQHPDVLLAQLGLAYSLFAQGGNSVVNNESAAAIYERIRDLPTADVDLRAEAGYMWGYALAKRGSAKNPDEKSSGDSARLEKAITVYWSVVNDFVLDPKQAAQLRGKGRYWVSRSLLELGQLLEDAGRLDEAQRAYRIIVDNKLGGAAQAQAKLARFHAAGKTTP
jgi:tetratricopeptide (TPR) repeat protein